MDVSNFELVWKPQSPAAPGGTTGIDKVFQGYFLEITNLEDVAYSYAVEFVAAPASVPERSLAGNTIVFVDTPGTNNVPGVLNGNFTSTVFTPSTGSISIPPKGTALIAVLPSAFLGLPFDTTPITTPNFEVRGYVRLRLPAVFRFNGAFFRRVSQAAAPVRVMLTPQNRATYYNSAGGLTNQTQSSLPTATGAAVALLPPDPPFFFPPLGEKFDLATLTRLDAMMQEEDRGLLMASLLASIDTESADLDAMNAQLAKAGISVALQKIKLRQ